MIIDAHIHSDSRAYEDFKKISMAGVKKAVTCAYDPLEMKKSNVTLEHFNRLLTVEKSRVEKNNIQLYIALGIHPRAIPDDYENVLKVLPEYMKKEDVIAIGEIGIENVTSKQVEVFEKQLQFAQEYNHNVIVHTPRSNKKEVTQTIMDVLDENIDAKLVQLDHVDFSIVDDVLTKDYTPAITVQPHKMSVEDTVNMLDEYGFDRFVLDSDMSYAPSNPMSLAEVKHELEVRDYEKESIDKVMYKNFLNFHNINL